MRNFLFILALIFIYLISGIFTVDTNQAAVVYYSKDKVLSYNSGLYWKPLFYGDLQYIDTNNQVSYYASSQPYRLSSGFAVNSGVIVTWKVIDYKKYVILNNNKSKFNQSFVTTINDIVSNIAAKSKDSAELLNGVNMLNNVKINDLGIDIVSLNIVNISNKNNINSASLNLESAYNSAIMIKSQADNVESASLMKMKTADAKFYAYYMKIVAFQESAVSRSEIPPIKNILSN